MCVIGEKRAVNQQGEIQCSTCEVWNAPEKFGTRLRNGLRVCQGICLACERERKRAYRDGKARPGVGPKPPTFLEILEKHRGSIYVSRWV